MGKNTDKYSTYIGGMMSIDTLEVFEIFKDDLEILDEIFNEFQQTHETYFKNIEEAISQKNAKNLELHAHTLKGVMRNFYYDPAVTYLQDLETSGRNENFDGVSGLHDIAKEKVLIFLELFKSQRLKRVA